MSTQRLQSVFTSKMSSQELESSSSSEIIPTITDSEDYNQALKEEIKNYERSLNTDESIGELICSTSDENERVRKESDQKLMSKLTSQKTKFDDEMKNKLIENKEMIINYCFAKSNKRQLTTV